MTSVTHQLAVYLARHNAEIRAAITISDPTLIATYDTMYAAIIAMDAVRSALVELLP